MREADSPGYDVPADNTAGGDDRGEPSNIADTDDGAPSEEEDAGGEVENWDHSVFLEYQLYCSAPNSDGVVTVVGLAGTFPPFTDVVIRGAGDAVSTAAAQDGGMVARLSAAALEALSVVATRASGVSETQTIIAGVSEDGPIGSDIVGSGEHTVLGNDNAVIQGVGAGLRDGDIVVGGNLTRNTGRATPVACNDAGCVFGLLIPGQVGDEVELFLVPDNSRSGRTDVQALEL